MSMFTIFSIRNERTHWKNFEDFYFIVKGNLGVVILPKEEESPNIEG